MDRSFLGAMLALVFMVVPVCADEAVEHRGEDLDLGNWKITAHQTNVTHRFTHCTASTIYTAETALQRRNMRSHYLTLMVKILADGTGRIDLRGDEWQLLKDKKYVIAFRFDDGQAFHVNGSSGMDQVVSADFNMDADWYKAMMTASSVELFIENKSIGRYRLNDSFRALKALYTCVARNMVQDGATASNGDTFGDGPQRPASSSDTITGSTF